MDCTGGGDDSTRCGAEVQNLSNLGAFGGIRGHKVYKIVLQTHTRVSTSLAKFFQGLFKDFYPKFKDFSKQKLLTFPNEFKPP